MSEPTTDEPTADCRFGPGELVQLRSGRHVGQFGIVLSVERDFYKGRVNSIRTRCDIDRLEVLWTDEDAPPYITFEPALCLERLPTEDE